MDAVNGPGATQGQPTTFIASVHEVRAAEQRLPPVQAQASGPFGPSVTDDVNRYKHDGTQPMRDKATPSHKKDVEWTIRH